MPITRASRRSSRHEYFHNWTGNRVTCRDWFQLSLKEGLTVYPRSGILGRPGQPRGAAHRRCAHAARGAIPRGCRPARPSGAAATAIIEIDNFYTATVYNKGAEVVRMIAHPARHGRVPPRHGSLFRAPRQSGRRRSRISSPRWQDAQRRRSRRISARWYNQAGTPEITVEDRYDPAARAYELTLSQRDAADAGPARQSSRWSMPIAMGLLGAGRRRACRRGSTARAKPRTGTRVLVLSEARATAFRFVDVPSAAGAVAAARFLGAGEAEGHPARPAASSSRSTTPTRSRAGKPGSRSRPHLLLGMVAAHRRGDKPPLDPALIAADATRRSPTPTRDPAFAAEALGAAVANPSSPTRWTVVDVDAIHAARESARAADRLGPRGRIRCRSTTSWPIAGPTVSTARRSAGARCAMSRSAISPPANGEWRALAKAQFDTGGNMTDVLAALSVLNEFDQPARAEALASFYEHWKRDELVIDKWFACRRSRRCPARSTRAKELTASPGLHDARTRTACARWSAPSRRPIQLRFHDASGAGYAFLADEVHRARSAQPD